MNIPTSLPRRQDRSGWSLSSILRFCLAEIRALRVLAMALTDGPALFDRLPATVWYEEMTEQLLRALSPADSDHLLDLGCGSGRHAIQAAHLVSQVTAADHSLRMLELAQRNQRSAKTHNLILRQEDGEALSFPDHAFDLATGFMLLPAFEEPTKVIGELLRVVKPGGRIGLLNPSWSLNPLAAWSFSRERGHQGFDLASLMAWAHTRRRFSPEGLLRSLRHQTEGEIRLLPLLGGMAFAAVVTKPGGQNRLSSIPDDASPEPHTARSAALAPPAPPWHSSKESSCPTLP